MLIIAVVSMVLAGVLTVRADAASTNNGKCGEKLYWTYNSSSATLTISGKGAMYDYSVDSGADSGEASGKEPGWYKKSIRRIIIEEGVTRIGRSAFSSLGGLTSVVLPYDSLYGCDSLSGEY